MTHFTMDDVREARRIHGGYCVRGVSAWLERHGMNLRGLVRDGYPVEKLEAIDDEFGRKVALIARKRTRG